MLSSTSSYLGFLKAFSGSTFGDGDTANIKSDIDSTVLDIPLSNIQLTTGSVINFGNANAVEYDDGYAPSSVDGLTVISFEAQIRTKIITNNYVKSIHDDPFSETVISVNSPSGTITFDIDDEGNVVVTDGGETEAATGILVTQLTPSKWEASFDRIKQHLTSTN